MKKNILFSFVLTMVFLCFAGGNTVLGSSMVDEEAQERVKKEAERMIVEIKTKKFLDKYERDFLEAYQKLSKKEQEKFIELFTDPYVALSIINHNNFNEGITELANGLVTITTQYKNSDVSIADDDYSILMTLQAKGETIFHLYGVPTIWFEHTLDYGWNGSRVFNTVDFRSRKTRHLNPGVTMSKVNTVHDTTTWGGIGYGYWQMTPIVTPWLTRTQVHTLRVWNPTTVSANWSWVE